MSWLAWLRHRLFGGPLPGRPVVDTDPDLLDLRRQQHLQLGELTKRGLNDDWNRLRHGIWWDQP